MVHVDPEALAGAASGVLDASVDLGVSWQDSSQRLTGLATAAAESAAGNTNEGAALVGEHVGCAEAASAAFDNLRGVLEYMSDGLYACAFGYVDTDETTASSFEVR